MTETKKNRKTRKTYDDQFKRDAVKLLAQPGYTLAKTAEALGGITGELVQLEEDGAAARVGGLGGGERAG